jgi:hypothetical protein
VGKLAQIVEGLELEPLETELRSISKEMTSFKTRAFSSQSAYRIRQPSCGDKCMRAPSRGQQSHDKRSEASSQLLRCLGVVQEGSEAISIETQASKASASFFQVWIWWRLQRLRRRGATDKGTRRDGTPLWSLGMVQANDAGWPTFQGKYVEPVMRIRPVFRIRI